MTTKTRTKHTAAFRAKVALEAVREQQTVPEIAKRSRAHANQVYKWKKEFLDNIERTFEHAEPRSEAPNREEELLKKIGELTIERDFLSRGLERIR